ncbi:MAG TPA: translation elongation factor Ts [Chthonomonas sp.]|uniref:translation elongation factor Ts n=1 Tax=Chthonomonas sp. TaxID=2282153 RepID=UPI002B4AD748|nr:translation elongation factor Ts [Chthonomonas sp.]HLI48632.1 translation elongation factor Ts [Chthonomonas sp.]
MPEITAAMVKELRERTGAAMMLCKEALVETGGDFEEAIVYIRKKLGAKLSDRGDRVAAEGVIAVAVVDDRDAAIIELNSETDFVARSEDFKKLAKELAEQVARSRATSTEELLKQPSLVDMALTVQDRIHDVFSRLRENIVFRRFAFVSTDETGHIATYVHVPANDRIGVLVEVGAESPEAARSEEIKHLGHELAMQIAASRPRYLTREEVPEEVLEQERDIARTVARNEGRPEAAIEKIVEGRLRKFYEETVLLDQPYLREPKKTIAQLLKEVGKGAHIRRFIRYEVGEQTGGASTSGAIKETVE